MRPNRDRLIKLVADAFEQDQNIASTDTDETGVFVYFHNGVDYRVIVERA